MTLERKEIRKGQQGFTLVELAVVMIIVGLLIGGILKGQQLIANAQVTSTISQARGIETAVSTFRDSYRAMPGDMSNATTRLPNCTAAPCGNGSGTGRLSNLPNAAATVTDDGFLMFIHLLRADLLSGFEGTDAASTAFGINLPSASIGGGYYAGYINTNSFGASTTARQGHYLTLRGTDGAPSTTEGAVDANGAFRIDGKMDDGIGDTGTVFADSATNCLTGSDYDTGNNAPNCNLYLRIQN
jgi:prepilin-type N-terminal cleavage/methylation domain-containing protein